MILFSSFVTKTIVRMRRRIHFYIIKINVSHLVEILTIT